MASAGRGSVSATAVPVVTVRASSVASTVIFAPANSRDTGHSSLASPTTASKSAGSSPGTLAVTSRCEETMVGIPPASSRVTVAVMASRSGTALRSPSRSASAIA